MNNKDLLYKKLNALRLEIDSLIVNDIIATADDVFRQQNGAKPHVSGSLPLAQIEEQLNSLTDDQRLSLISRYCHGCGSTDKSCQCWNDD